jgi:transcriptional regulator with XRE-family HTH domain
MSVMAGTRRSELAAFLRARRSEVRPEEVGLPPGPRRRTPGLRREEVAQLAGVGVTWYTWLEQGRPINASAQVLDAVARVLRLDPAGHAHLYRLAGIPDVAPAAAELPSQVQTVLDAVDPIPAAVYDGRYDLLAHNAPYADIFPAICVATGMARNALWQLLVDPSGDCPLLTLEAIPRMVAIARGNFSRHLGEPGWERFVAALTEASPEFARLWSTHDVADSGTLRKEFRCPAVGIVELESASFAIHGTPEARMLVYTPVTAADAAKLARLRARR